jgi:uncharacterized repeat protein (TIGR04138 family)
MAEQPHDAHVRDGFRLDAYHFLHRALRYTQVTMGREGHVTGTELLEGFRFLALQEFGPMARVVLDHWGVHTTDDVGAMVRSLVEGGEWGRREEESWDEFRGTFDFATVFEAEYPWNVREALNLAVEARRER